MGEGWGGREREREREREYQFNSFLSLDRLDRRWDMRDDSKEILFQPFLQEVLVSSAGMGTDVPL